MEIVSESDSSTCGRENVSCRKAVSYTHLRVKDVIELGSHHMFLADVLGVSVDEAYMDEKGKFDMNRAGMMVYSHGEYFGLGKQLGTFGYSVRKTKK